MVSDVEREIIPLCSELSTKDIAFEMENEKISVSSHKLRGFGGVASVYVPLHCYDQAKAVAKALDFHFPEEVTVTPLDDAAKSNDAGTQTSAGVGSKGNKKPQQEEELSPMKRRLGRFLLFLSVIAVVAAVVFFSDIIIGLVKGLFG